MSVVTRAEPLAGLADLIGGSETRSRSQLSRAMLRIAREHLGAEVAFVSEFVADRRVFRTVESDLDDCPVHEGGSDPVAESFCGKIVDGTLPLLMTDARQNPVAAAMPVTSALPVGGHVSVPLRLGDGTVFGTFCCFSRHADPSLTDRDLSVVQLIASMLAPVIDSERRASAAHDTMVEELTFYCAGGLQIVLQPIVDMHTRLPVGFEALSRFPGSGLKPDEWFAAAQQVGWGVRLEVASIAAALDHLDLLPDDCYLSVNTSAATLTSRELAEVLVGRQLDRIVFEITEHTESTDQRGLDSALAALRNRGARIAVDDAGSGYAGLRQILQLHPDILKLDLGLIRDIDTDPARQALAWALGWFAQRTGAALVAEGVETDPERQHLQGLGVIFGQGYLFARPLPPGEAVATALERARSHALAPQTP